MPTTVQTTVPTKLYGCDEDFSAFDEFEDDPPNTDDEQGICPSCNGSGEGQYDGSRCSTCCGHGTQ